MLIPCVKFLTLLASSTLLPSSNPETAQATPDAPPPLVTLSELPRFLQHYRGAGTELRIAYLGICPDSQHEGLQATDYFHLHRRSECVASVAADTELALWLRQAWPHLTLITVDIPAMTTPADALASLQSGIAWALDYDPQVLVIREELLDAASFFDTHLSGQEEVRSVFAACWEKACLPIVVSTKWQHSTGVFPGVLRVQLIDGELFEASKPTDRSGDSHSGVPLGLPVAVLADRPEELDEEHAALAYVGLGSAAVAGTGSLAHLDLAGHLWQAAITWTADLSDRQVRFRMLDITRSFQGEYTVPLFDENVPPEFLVAHSPGWHNCQHYGDTPPERLMLAGVYGAARWAHLDIAAQLTYVHPTVLSSAPEKGFAFFRLDERLDPQSMGTVIRFWEAHTSEDEVSGNLLYTVQPNTALKSD